MSWTTYRHRADAYLDEALAVTGKRIKASEWLMDNTEWDLFATVWVSVDRTQHCLSNYVAPDHPDFAKNTTTAIGAKTRSIYKQLDDAIGSFLSRSKPDDLILFISDHGFQSCTRALHMDHLLHQFGYLEFSASNAIFGPMQWGPVRNVARKVYDLLGLHGKVSLPQSVNWAKTQAYTTIRSTGEGVSINLAGRDVDGIVDPADFERVRGEVMDRLASFVDPKTGKKPVKAIFKREDVFKGKHADTAPDILMEPNEGYSSDAREVRDRGRRLGERRPPHGRRDRGGRTGVTPFTTTPYLIDMAPTMLAALDAPAGIKHTGSVLSNVVGSEASVKSEAVAGTVEIADEEQTVSDTEADEMEEHLRGLGYLE